MSKIKWRLDGTIIKGQHFKDATIYIFIYTSGLTPDIRCPLGYFNTASDIERLLGIKRNTPIKDCKLAFEAFVALNGW